MTSRTWQCRFCGQYAQASTWKTAAVAMRKECRDYIEPHEPRPFFADHGQRSQQLELPADFDLTPPPGTPDAGACPQCSGRLRVSMFDDAEVACMDCTWASYDPEPGSNEESQVQRELDAMFPGGL